MKAFVLYGKNGLESGRVLGDELSKRLSDSGHSVKKGRISRLERLQDNGSEFDYVINVGWYKPTAVPHNCLIVNVPEGVSNSSNKRKARIRFKQLGIPAPRLWLRGGNILEADLPVVGRTTHHMKGWGLWYCETLEQVRTAVVEGATHFLKFIRNTREFRVHVMATRLSLGGDPKDNYKVIKLSEKNPGPGVKHNAIVKNHESGWVFGYPKNKKDPGLPLVRSSAKKTISSFGLHWGAVDIMVSGGAPYVLEINSTPCLTDDNASTLDRYVFSIGRLLGVNVKPAAPKINPNLASFLSRNKF